MMKHAKLLTLLLVAVLLLSACEGGLTGSQGEEMEFTEDEAADIPEDEGMEFTEDDLADEADDGFDFSEDDEVGDEPVGDNPADDNPDPDDPEPGDDDEGYDFDEDEDLEPGEDVENELPARPVFPPLGKSTWLINHGGGQMVCDSGMTLSIDAGDPATVEIEAGPLPDMDLMLIENFDGTGATQDFWRTYDVPFAFYWGIYEIAGTDEELRYEVYFDTSTGDGDVADIMYGTISNESHGCLTTRDFDGTLVD